MHCRHVPIERFYSRGQHLCKFIGTKESVCIRKEFNSHRTGLGHQHGRRFIVLGHQYGRRDVMSEHSIPTKRHTHLSLLWLNQSDSYVGFKRCSKGGNCNDNIKQGKERTLYPVQNIRS